MVTTANARRSAECRAAEEPVAQQGAPDDGCGVEAPSAARGRATGLGVEALAGRAPAAWRRRRAGAASHAHAWSAGNF
jgi:hypothetical protein